MSSQRPIKLFDLTSTLSPQPWSPHTWRTRFVLNYKKIPYTTEWIGISGIAPVLKPLGAPPTRKTEPMYTAPAIVDPNPEPPVVLSDSSIIADYLEKTYPEPSIYPHGRDAHAKWTAAMVDNIIMKMAFLVMPTTSRILPPEDAEYFNRSRKEIFGIDVKDMIAKPEEEEKQWQGLQEGLNVISALADEVDHGDKWLFGTARGPGYADFVLAAAFIWFDKAGPDGGWARVKTWNGGKWERAMKNVEEYMQVL